MTDLQPTPELLAVARLVAARKWTLGPDVVYSSDVDPHLDRLFTAGLVDIYYAAPERRVAGTDEDRWTLTEAGREWLAKHDTAAEG